MMITITRLSLLLLIFSISFPLFTKAYEKPIDGKTPGGLQPNAFAFIENKGQIVDQHGQSRSDIDFKLSVPGLDIFIGSGQIHYQWSRALDTADGTQNGGLLPFRVSRALKETRIERYRMEMALVGANRSAKPEATEKQPYFERYYQEKGMADGTVVQSYSRIIYRNIYQGVDWVLYLQNNELKYDFIVHPGGAVNQIKLQYKGAESLKIVNGALTASCPLGSITEQAPYSYEAATGKNISSAYRLEGDMLSFDIASFKGKLVIDPVLAWATYYGGSNDDGNGELTVDPADNVYMSGYTSSSNNIATTGSFQSAYLSGAGNSYLVKFNTSGVRQWATYYGHNSLFEIVYSGNSLYIAGATSTVSGVATPGTYQPVYGGGSWDALLVNFDLNGARNWATYFGGAGLDAATVVDVDGSGNIYLAGRTESHGLATPNTHKQNISNGEDLFLARFSAAGNLVWCSYYGGDSLDMVSGISSDLSGNIYMAGSTHSITGIATTGSHKSSSYNAPTSNQTLDGFLAKFNSSGTLAWGTYYGDIQDDRVHALATDNNGNAYIGGLSASTAGIATVGSQQPTGSGAFLAKFNSLGVRQWGTYYGDDSWIADILVNSQGNIYVCGTNRFNLHLIVTPTGFQNPSQAGNYCAFYSIFNQAGHLVFGTTLSGNNFRNEFASMTVTDSEGIIYLSGGTISSSGIATNGAHQTTHGGGLWDAMLVKYLLDTGIHLSYPFIDTVLCTDTLLELPYTVTHAFGPGNSFTAQLSDASGSFSSPTNVGSVTATGSGIISCNVPIGLPQGTGYRLRVVASNPVRVSADNGKDIVFHTMPNPIASANTPLCSGNTLNLSTPAGATGFAYSWSGPNSYTSVFPSPSVPNAMPTHTGLYTVEVENNGCKRSSSVHVVVNQTPATPVATAATPACQGGDVQLFASNVPGAGYQWTGPQNFSSTQQNPVIPQATVAMSGAYSVVAVANNCSSASSTVNVQVNIAATVGAYASPGDTVCAGTNVQFVGFPQGAGTNPVFAWYKNGSVVSTSKVYRDSTLVTGDKVWCTVTATGICATPVVVSTDTFRMVVLNIKTHPKVTIQATPEPTGDPDQGIHFLAVATHGGPEPKYQWYINDVPTGGNTLNISMAGVVIGTEIKVEMMSNDPCADQPYAVDSLLVAFPTGIDGQQHKGGLRLYPNPNKGSFTIGGVTANELNVSIVNALGQEVYSARYAGVNGSQAIDASLVPGNYLIKLQTEGGMEVLRFVVD